MRFLKNFEFKFKKREIPKEGANFEIEIVKQNASIQTQRQERSDRRRSCGDVSVFSRTANITFVHYMTEGNLPCSIGERRAREALHTHRNSLDHRY